jgi:DNA-binding NarL/FixJ family response regulator
MTLSSAPDVAAEAFELGATGYLVKTCAASELTLAVYEVLRGKTYLSKGMSRDTINSICWEHKKLVDVDERLTDRQREILQLLAEGKIPKEIGGILHVSHSTVLYHNLRRRTGQIRHQKPHRGRLIRSAARSPLWCSRQSLR